MQRHFIVIFCFGFCVFRTCSIFNFVEMMLRLLRLGISHRYIYTMDGAPPVGQRLGIEVEYKRTDEGQGPDGLIFDAHHSCLFTFLN